MQLVKNRLPTTNYPSWTTACLLIIATLFLAACSSGSSSSSAPKPDVTVPDVVGQTQANAETAILNANLIVGNVSQASNQSVAAGNVISQNPAANSSVASGSAVDLVVSSGPTANVSVPDVVGQTQANAETAIVNANLIVGNVSQASSQTVAVGNVISQNPTANSSVASGSAVDLVVSSGPPAVVNVRVPNVVGQRQIAAETLLAELGLNAGNISTVSSETLPVGVVISQTPAPGSNAASGDSVALVISTGSSTANIPTLDVQVWIDINNDKNNILTANNTDLQATVSLQQGDTLLTGNTDANGRVTFNNVSKPFTITGQADFTHAGATYRSALSIHNLNPNTNQIGIYIPGPEQGPAQATTASISGTISNIPVIPTGFSLYIFAEPVNACCGTGMYVTGASNGAPTANQTYTLPNVGVGTHKVYASIVRYNNGVNDFSAAAVHPIQVTTTDGAASTAIDIDFNDPANSVTFTNKMLTVNNFIIDERTAEIRVRSTVEFATIGELDFQGFSQTTPPLNLPAMVSVVNSIPTNSTVKYEFNSSTKTREKSATKVVLDATTPLSFDLIDSPALVTPRMNQVFTVADAVDMPVHWTLPAATQPSFNLVALFSNQDFNADTGITGIDYVQWWHTLPSEGRGLTLPHTALPVFAPDRHYILLTAPRKSALTQDYNNVFGFDFINNTWLQEDVDWAEATHVSAISTVPSNVVPTRLADYIPLQPASCSTMDWISGPNAGTQYELNIGTNESVNYASGTVTGTVMDHGGMFKIVASNDGRDFKFLKYNDDAISTDCNLTAHSDEFSFGKIYDGLLFIQPGDFVNVNTLTPTACTKGDNMFILFKNQQVTVPGMANQDALVMYWLDPKYTHQPLNFPNGINPMGIIAPTSVETSGMSVTDFDVYVAGVGQVGFGGVDAATGNVPESSVRTGPCP